MSGHRGYFLKDWGVVLNQALINYGIAFLRKRNYTVLQTPFLMRKDVMAETAQLSQFDEELYKVEQPRAQPADEAARAPFLTRQADTHGLAGAITLAIGQVVSGDGNDKYLIATSEQPISAFHRGEWLEPKDLPLR